MTAASSLEDKIAWAILQALHESVPETDRPMAWSDMNEAQEKRIRSAAAATMLTIAKAGFIEAVEEIGRERVRDRLMVIMNDHGVENAETSNGAENNTGVVHRGTAS